MCTASAVRVSSRMFCRQAGEGGRWASMRAGGRAAGLRGISISSTAANQGKLPPTNVQRGSPNPPGPTCRWRSPRPMTWPAIELTAMLRVKARRRSNQVPAGQEGGAEQDVQRRAMRLWRRIGAEAPCSAAIHCLLTTKPYMCNPIPDHSHPKPPTIHPSAHLGPGSSPGRSGAALAGSGCKQSRRQHAWQRAQPGLRPWRAGRRRRLWVRGGGESWGWGQ